jgi:uncharacterized protein (TIGR02246 family)
MMRQLMIIAALVCVACAAHAAEKAAPKSDAGKLKADIVNEEAVRKLYEEFTVAWNKHDVPTMAEMWAEDGDDVEPDGHVAKGRAEVKELLKLEHGSIFKNTHLTINLETVWFITGDVALGDGTYELTGVVTPDGKPIPPRKGRLSTIFLSERGRWWIAASRLMIPAALPYRKEGKS